VYRRWADSVERAPTSNAAPGQSRIVPRLWDKHGLKPQRLEHDMATDDSDCEFGNRTAGARYYGRANCQQSFALTATYSSWLNQIGFWYAEDRVGRNRTWRVHLVGRARKSMKVHLAAQQGAHDRTMALLRSYAPVSLRRKHVPFSTVLTPSTFVRYERNV
jgi:hypothetical protein